MATDVQDYQPAPTHESARGTGHQSVPSNSTVTTVNDNSTVPLKLEATDTTTPPNGVDTDTDDANLPEPRHLLERIPTVLQPSIPWRKRLMHFTFAWYTVT